jgi:ubiquinone biosynthesis protein Coq4
MLAHIVSLTKNIVVTGSHGKTTTTSLLAAIFSKTKLGKKILEKKINLVDTLKDKNFLESLPKNTLGYKYFEFIYKENLSPEELIDASNNIDGRDLRGRSEDEIFLI